MLTAVGTVFKRQYSSEESIKFIKPANDDKD